MIEALKKKYALSDQGAKDLFKGIVYSVLADVSLMFPVILLAVVLNQLLAPLLGTVAQEFSTLFYTGIGILILAVVFILHYLQYTVAYMGTYAESARWRIRLAEKLRTLPLAFFHQRDLSDLTSTIMEDCASFEHAFSHTVPQFWGAVISTSVVCVGLQVKRLKEIEECPEEAGEKNIQTDGFDITFDHVKFSYGKDKSVLQDVSFTAKQRRVTTLVGPSGGGKSTVAKLAAKFYSLESGKILLGGKEIASLDSTMLMKNFSIVFQDVALFNNTVMENIRVGRKDATDEDVIAAAKAAMCHEFIERLPQGYQTVIGENGSTLSGGECQRLSIAYRMRTFEAADRIVALADGTVAESGIHSELMEKKGLYRKLVDLQTKSANWTLNVNV